MVVARVGQVKAHPGEDALIDLAHGLVVGHAARPLLVHLATCADCERLFREISGRRERLLAEGAPTPGRSNPSMERRRVWPWLAAAAMLAVAVAAPLLVDRKHPVLIDALLPAEGETTLMRSGDHVAGLDSFIEALEVYRARDPRLAARLFREADVPEGYDGLRRLYLASALLLVGEPDESLAVLETLNVDTLPQPWRDEARWVAYLGLRERGDAEAARPRLEQLADSPGEIGDRARRELQSGGPVNTKPDQ